MGIAELKMSHNVGGISKLRTEQQKIQEQHEQEQYKRFLAQFTMENFLEKVPTHDPKGAEKGKKEAIARKAKEDEDRKMAAMPAWKKELIQKKMEDPKSERRRRKEREKERKKKLILKL